jgi:hypothetical protein
MAKPRKQHVTYFLSTTIIEEIHRRARQAHQTDAQEADALLRDALGLGRPRRTPRPRSSVFILRRAHRAVSD